MSFCYHCKETKDKSTMYTARKCWDCKRKQSKIDRDKLMIDPLRRAARNKREQSRRSNPNRKYSVLKQSAKSRKIPLDITRNQYYDMCKKGLICHYCNGELVSDDKGTGHGLDRLDSTKPYSIENCVPCCYACNRIKSDFLTPEETKIAVMAIIEYRKVVMGQK